MATDHIEAGIQDITGVGTATAQFITSAQKFVVASVPKDLLHFAQKASSASTDGSAISFSVNDSIIDVQRNGYSCEEIPMSEAVWALDSTSLKYATAKHPTWYHKQGAVHFAPVTDGSNAGYVFYVDYSKIDDDSDLRNAVIFRAASSEFTKLATSTIPTWDDVVVPIAPNAPSFGNDLSIASTSPAVPVITASTVDSSSWVSPGYTKPVFSAPSLASVGDLTLPSVPVSPSLSTSTVSFSQTAPTYTAPVLNLESAPTITDLDVSVLAPMAPAIRIITYQDGVTADVVAPTEVNVSANAPSYTKPVISLPTLSSITDLTVSVPAYITPSLKDVSVTFSAAVPTYTKPVLSLTAAPTITSLSINSVTPDLPKIISNQVSFSTSVAAYTAPVVSLSTFEAIDDLVITAVEPAPLRLASKPVIDMTTPASKVPVYTAPVVALPTFPTLDWTLPTRPIASSLNAESSSTGGVTVDLTDLGTVPGFTPPVMTSPDWNDTEKWINTEEDPEMNVARIQTIQAQISEYQAKLQEAQSSFNQENVEYQAKLQIALQNAAQANSGDTTLLQGHSNAVQLYTQEIQSIIGKNSGQIQEWQSESGGSLQEYQANIQNNLNVFQAESVEFQAYLQEALEEAKLEAGFNDDKLQQYQTDIQEYTAIVSKQVQEYQANLAKKVQIFQAENENKLRKYQSDIQNNLNTFQRDIIDYNTDLQIAVQNAELASKDDAQSLVKYSHQIQEYQASITKEIEQHRANTANDIKVWEAKRQSELADYTTSIQNELNVFNKENAVYQAELQVAIQKSQLEHGGEDRVLQKYSYEIQNYQAQVTKAIEEFNTNVNKDIQVYNSESGAVLSQYQADIQNELNVFNKENARYQVELQEAVTRVNHEMETSIANMQKEQTIDLQNKTSTMQSLISDNESKLSVYQANLQNYQAQVQKEVQEYELNLRGDLDVWQAERTTDLQKYQADIQNSLNSFNKESTEYQAQLQVSLKNADLSDSADSKKISLYQNDLSAYQAEIGAIIQEWTQEEWTQKFGKYQADYTALLQEYQANIQNELNEFNKETTIYQAEIQKSIQDAQLESAEESQKLEKYAAELNQYTQDINKEVQDYTNTLAKEVQEYQSKVALYTADLQKYQGEVASEAQKTALNSQTVQIYEKEAEKYYAWATAEVQMYVQNNSRMMGITIAAQQQAAQQ